MNQIKSNHACHRFLSDCFASFLPLALIRSSRRKLSPLSRSTPLLHHPPSSSISVTLSIPTLLASWIERTFYHSMAFPSLFHPPSNVNGKDIVSCYTPPSGCNAALKMPWLQRDVASAHSYHSFRFFRYPIHLGSLGGRRLQLHVRLLQFTHCQQHQWNRYCLS